MTLRELLLELRSGGLSVAAHQVHYGIQAGYLPRPEMDGSGRYRFASADLSACRKHFKNPPKPGRKKQPVPA